MSPLPTLLNLPAEVLIHIFKYLAIRDIHSIILTCKIFKDIVIHDNGIWKCLTRDNFLVHNSTNNRKQIKLSNYSKTRVSRNWCKGIYSSRILVDHNENYMPWIQYFNSEYLFVSVGSEIICFPTNRIGMPDCSQVQWRTYVPCVMRYDIRTNDVSRFIIRDSFLVCGNRDGCASVFQMSNLKQKPQLIHHIKDCHEGGQAEVTAVEMVVNSHVAYVVTCSDQCPQLGLFSLETDESKTVMIPNIVGIKCLATNKYQDKVALGVNGSDKPVLFDLNSDELLMGAERIRKKQTVRDIQWHDDNTITFVTHSGILQSIDVRTEEVVYQAEDPFQSTLYCVKTDGQRAIVVGSSQYSRCVLFDTRYWKRYVQNYFTQKRSSPVYSLDFDATKLIAASDRSIAILNYYVSSANAIARDYSQIFEVVR